VDINFQKLLTFQSLVFLRNLNIFPEDNGQFEEKVCFHLRCLIQIVAGNMYIVDKKTSGYIPKIFSGIRFI
jgi:hypothetical protein